MKRLGLVLVLLACFITADGFCGAARQDRFKPLNNFLIGMIKNDYKQNLDDLGYYLSAPITFTTKDEGAQGKIDLTGRFLLNQNKKTKELRITNSEKGKYVNYDPSSKDTFVIMFSGRFVLTFESNAKTTGFDLTQAVDTKNEFVYTKNEEEDHIPHLRIYYRYTIDNNNELIPGATLAAASPVPPLVPSIDTSQLTQALDAAKTEASQLTVALENTRTENTELAKALANTRTEAGQLTLALENTRKEAGLLTTELSAAKDETIQLKGEIEKAYGLLFSKPTPQPIPDPGNGQEQDNNPPPTPSRDIEGSGSLDKNDIVDHIRSNNPTTARRDIEALIDAYIREAQRENINYDIAVAQMCYATTYLKDLAFVNIHNYAGFDAINGIPVRYADMNEGVRAHIQHLKGYASHERPQGNIVDKRFQILVNNRILGTVKTLDSLFRVWAPGNYQSYGNSINNILAELYRISGR